MKKGRMSFAALALGTVLLAGCGTGAETNLDLHKMPVDKYVVPGDYTGLSISVEGPTVNQEQWDGLTLAVYQSYGSGIAGRAVETGDTVEMDYEGKLDGVAFDGGTAAGAQLTVGSGEFIDGFEDGLVGVMPGETVVLDLTFPEDFRSADLAGKPVVFTVTVKRILPALDDMEDSVVAAQNLDGVSTVEGLRQYVYDYLMENAQRNYQYRIQDALLSALMDASKFEELPQTLVDSYKEGISRDLASLAAGYSMTADAFANYYYNVGSEDYVRFASEAQARQEVLLQAIANREGLGVGDEELDGLLEEHAANLEYDSVEDLLKDFDREECRNYFMAEKVINYIKGFATIVEP